MTHSPLISVVVPTFNVEGTLAACLESLAHQTFRDFEVVVQDGGSRDGTRALCEGFRSRLELSWASEPDRGVYDAMNRAVLRARGRWLYFLGADDLVHDPGVFEDLASTLAQGGHNLVYGDVWLRNAGARYAGAFDLDRLLHGCNICHQAIFYDRELFEHLGNYHPRYPVWADWDLNIRCFKFTGIRPLWVDRVIALYNDGVGVSRQEDPVLAKELPLLIKREVKAEFRASRAYRWGRLLFGWLDRGLPARP